MDGIFDRAKSIEAERVARGEKPNPNLTTTKSFRVAAISSTTNSFGLTGHVLIARDGAAFEVGRSRGPWNPGWDKGTDVNIPVDEKGQPEWAKVSCEIPRALPVAPANIVKEIFS